MLVSLPNIPRLFTGVRWSLNTPQQLNRSGFTSRTQVIGLPGAETWEVSASFKLLSTEGDVRKLRAFLTTLRGAENTFHMPALPSQQTATANPSVTAQVSGTVLTLNSVDGLEPGMQVTIPQVGGHKRLVTITSISVLNITFQPFLTGTAVLGAIEIQNPYCLMRMKGPVVSWDDNGTVVSQMEAEEAL